MSNKYLQKNDSAYFSFKVFFDLILRWPAYDGNIPIDEIDLCIFYRKKDMTEGAIFTNNYRRGYEGSLVNPPYIQYMGEEYPNANDNYEEMNTEWIRITKIQDMDEIFIVAVDYCAVAGLSRDSFSVSLFLETGDTDPLLSMSYSKERNERGGVCLLASLLEVESGIIKIHNQSKIFTLEQACDNIPGFKILTN